MSAINLQQLSAVVASCLQKVSQLAANMSESLEEMDRKKADRNACEAALVASTLTVDRTVVCIKPGKNHMVNVAWDDSILPGTSLTLKSSDRSICTVVPGFSQKGYASITIKAGKEGAAVVTVGVAAGGYRSLGNKQIAVFVGNNGQMPGREANE